MAQLHPRKRISNFGDHDNERRATVSRKRKGSVAVSAPLEDAPNEEEESPRSSDEQSELSELTADRDTESESDVLQTSFQALMKSFEFDDDIYNDEDAKNQIRKSTELVRAPLGNRMLYAGDSKGNIFVIRLPNQHVEILLMDHSSSITIQGYLKVIVLSGIVSIHGYKIRPESEISVFSFINSGLYKISTTDSDLHTNKNQLKKKLRVLQIEEKYWKQILDRYHETTSIVVLEKQILPARLQFLKIYYPQVLDNPKPLNKISNEHLSIEGYEDKVILMNSKRLETINQVHHKILNLRSCKKRACIMVYGTNNVGKSTFLSYLINTVLENFEHVYYLDTDPGHTEFTLPSIVSLTKVTKPLLGPPFTHDQKSTCMMFTGSITPRTCPRTYVNSVDRIATLIESEYSHEVVFVNTMGWIQGLGDLCSRNIIDMLKPTIMIEFTLQGESPILKEQMKKDNVFYFEIENATASKGKFKLKQLRNFAITAYLGKCQKSYMRPTVLNSVRPYRVRWEDVAIHVMNKILSPSRLIEAINCSVVALCCVSSSYMRMYEKNGLPQTLKANPLCICVGFGFVRSIDETNHFLYIISPLSPEEISTVNAVIKGNVMVPNELLMHQQIFDVDLPYTDKSLSSSSQILENEID